MIWGYLLPTVIKGQPTSAEVIERLAALNEPVALSFSRGKDSIAAWCALEDAGIEVVPVFFYGVPGLRFEEESLAYFEQKFNKKIHRYPHPSFYKHLNEGVFQAPENTPVIIAAKLPTPTYAQMWEFVKDDLKLSRQAWVADGVRAADSIVRRASFVKHGIMKEKSRKVSPIADYLKQEVLDIIAQHGIELPIDYELFGRSFDGLDYRFTKPLKDNLPEDYERVCKWFPLIEADIVRHEAYGI